MKLNFFKSSSYRNRDLHVSNIAGTWHSSPPIISSCGYIFRFGILRNKIIFFGLIKFDTDIPFFKLF